MNIIFRVDVSYGVGTGHIYRCLNLARVLSSSKNNIYFLSKEINSYFKKKIINSGFNLKVIKTNGSLKNDFEQSKKYLKNINFIDLLIVDSYHLNHFWEKKISQYVAKILVIDDLFQKHFCDYLLNYSFKKYPKKLLMKKNCQLLFGPKYTILKDRYKADIKKKAINFVTKNLFIFFGGSDSNGITLKVARILKNDQFKHLKIFFIIGIFNKDKNKIKIVLKSNKNIKILAKLNDLYKVIRKCDTAIVSGGTVLLEVLAAQLKILVINQSYNQSYNSSYLKKYKFLDIIKIKNIKPNILLTFFNKKKNKKKLIDYYGAQRIKKILLRNYE